MEPLRFRKYDCVRFFESHQEFSILTVGDRFLSFIYLTHPLIEFDYTTISELNFGFNSCINRELFIVKNRILIILYNHDCLENLKNRSNDSYEEYFPIVMKKEISCCPVQYFPRERVYSEASPFRNSQDGFLVLRHGALF